MPIHWFPGHMSAARREILKVLPHVDLIIEVLDARIPFSSENPLISELRGQKPCIQIFNKSDLADPAITAAWLKQRATAPQLRVLTHHLKQPHLLQNIKHIAQSLVPPVRARAMNAMIVGIPNVGKSTLINTLSNRAIAKTGNKPAITQHQQRVQIGTDLVLLDTPGFLWHKLSPESCGYRLAVSGAISDRVVTYQDLAAFTIPFLRERYPTAVTTYYKLSAFPSDDHALLEAIGRARGYLAKGGIVDPQRASERLIMDLRDGLLGKISLERPEDF